jgi:hypothetical protein
MLKFLFRSRRFFHDEPMLDALTAGLWGLAALGVI